MQRKGCILDNSLLLSDSRVLLMDLVLVVMVVELVSDFVQDVGHGGCVMLLARGKQ